MNQSACLVVTALLASLSLAGESEEKPVTMLEGGEAVKRTQVVGVPLD